MLPIYSVIITSHNNKDLNEPTSLMECNKAGFFSLLKLLGAGTKNRYRFGNTALQTDT